MKQFYLSFLFIISSFLLTAQTGTSTEVGITEGQLSVSLTGAATYSVPIAVPLGINGIVPQVGLVYNSQSGKGVAGYGWNISGVSTITRIPATKFHDGTIDAVDFDALDRFAFDGQRLMVKSGTSGTYGANGTVYETENFSNVKITSYGVHPSGANYGPAYFIVEYPDGSKAYYGNSTDSRTIMNWSITYWENPQGVRISYLYNNTNNSLNIDTIKYGTLGTTTPINIVQFIYGATKRTEQAYIGGQSIINNKILNNIIVTSNGVGYRSYWMGYEDASLGYQRLKSITEKSGDGSKSYNPTIFDYDPVSSGITVKPITADLSLLSISSSNSATVTGDFDGDGKMDFLLYPTSGTDAKKKYWLFQNIDNSGSLSTGNEHAVGAFENIFTTSWLSSDNKLVPMQGWCVVKLDAATNVTSFNNYSTGIPIYSQGNKVYTFPKLSYYSQPHGCGGSSILHNVTIPKRYLNGDFNGDGLTDVLVIEENLEYSYMGECDVDGENVVYDVTRQGRSYFVNLDRRVAVNFVNDAGTLDINPTDKIETADVNGDGKSDILVFTGTYVYAYTLNSSNVLALLWSYTNAYISSTSGKPILLGDYNGDGKSDFLIPEAVNSTVWHKYISTGTTFVETSHNFSGFSYTLSDTTTDRTYIATDFNNDGKSDLLQLNIGGTVSQNVRCLLNSSDSFFNGSGLTVITESSGQILSKGALPIFLPSQDSNNNMELAFILDHQIKYYQSATDCSKERLLKKITTGNSVSNTITYQGLNQKAKDDNVYRDSAYIENYPNSDILFAPTMQVVSKLVMNSTAGSKTQSFTYYGAVYNVEGLGFLGFRSTGRTNWYQSDSSIITSISKFDVSLRGANTENYSVLGIKVASGTAAPSDFISKTVLGYTSTLGTNKVFNLKNTTSQQFNGLENTSTETTNIFDAYNNPTQSTTLVKQAGVTQQTTISNIVYDNLPSGTPYVIGRPNNKKQTVTVTGDTMNSEEQYLYTNSLLTQVKKFAGTDYITENNVYDTYGNITQKTITYPGLTARVTSYAYDATGRFLTKSTDIEGLYTTYLYNTDGTLKSETNPYNLTTSYGYDVWFKKIKTTDYLGKNVNYVYARNGVNTTITTTGDDGSVSEEIFDDLGRKTRSGSKDITGTFSYVSYLYDIYDRKVKVSEPYTTSATQWNESQYDVYGRLLKSISFTGKTVSMTYTGLVTKVDDGIKTKESTKNAIGNVVSIKDTPGGTINYTYFANGNLKNTEYGGVNTTIEQDVWGRKTKLTDPSAGVYTYTYNGFGESLTETTPNGTTTYALNAVGKPTQKTIVGTNTNSKTTYTYDSTTKLLTSSSFVDVSENNATTTTSYAYDTSKRLSSTTEVTPYATFVKQFTYDAFGRILNETSNASANGKSSNKAVQHTYKNGQPWQIIDTSNSQVLWQTNTVNARGQLTGATMANGNIGITNAYDSYGFITQTKRDRLVVSPGNILTLNTVFDAQRGNLTSRTNSLFGWSESFIYDALDRLTSFKNTAGVTETQNYDDRGRITQNAVGTYNYTNSAKVYQSTSVTLTPAALTYYQGDPTQNISYNAFKSPYLIEEVGKDKISFTYNDNNDRSTMFYGNTDANKLLRPYRKYYSADGSMEIKYNIQTGVMEFVTYIGGDGYTAPLVIKSDGTTQNYLYLQRDYQGSIVAITDASGNVLEKRLFDAWGNVLVQNGAGTTLNGLTLLDRGYTGHEHLQSVGLINMNGRLYDPKLHRFLQPDNNIQDPYNTQNYNRYGYVLNNPLKYTDPSGESWKSWWNDNWKSVVTIGAAVVTGVVIVASMGTATPLVAAMWAGAGAGFVGGTVGTALNGGTVGQSLMAGFTGALMGAATGYAGAYASAAIGAVGIIPGALSGAATSTTLGAMTNIISGNDWNAGLGMTAVFGAIGGGYSGFSAAKASGAGIWFGTEAKPSASVIAGNINKETAKAQAAYDKSTQVQAEPTMRTSVAKYQPENGGAMGEWITEMSTPGQMMDRFGNEFGTYASPAGTPFEMRSLPASTDLSIKIKFEVLKPFPVQKSFIAPAHYFPGGGIQYKLPVSPYYLEQNGYIKYH